MKKVLLSLVSCLVVFSFHVDGHAKNKQGGTYSFKDKNNKEYIGKTNDLDRRYKEHTNPKSGKLPQENKETFKTAPSNASKAWIRRTEETRIKIADIVTNGNLGNKQHAPMSRAASKK